MAQKTGSLLKAARWVHFAPAVLLMLGACSSKSTHGREVPAAGGSNAGGTLNDGGGAPGGGGAAGGGGTGGSGGSASGGGGSAGAGAGGSAGAGAAAGAGGSAGAGAAAGGSGSAGAAGSGATAGAGGSNTHSLATTQNKYATIIDNPSLSIVGDLTIELWIRPTLPGAGSHGRVILSKWLAGTANQRSYLIVLRPGSTPQFEFWISPDGQLPTGFLKHAHTPTVNQWTHLATTFEAATGTSRLYIAGSLVTQQTFPAITQIHDGNAALHIGRGEPSVAMDEWEGQLDEVRIWNVIRSANEIMSNMSQHISPTTPGLVGYWRLDNSLTDATPNGNHLAPVGAPSFDKLTPFN